jgi:glutamine synthetase
MATGMLSLGDLKREIAAGTIDTVVAAMVDMQGRLIGKRFHAQFFAESGHEETHGCNYLLGVDIEMEPVPGYKATSRDMATSCSSPTWRRSGAFPGFPAPRWSSATCSIITRTKTWRIRRAPCSRSSSSASRP